MSKPVKSQWDFGELFPSSSGSSGATNPTESRSAGRTVLSVSELTTQVKRLLEKSVGSVWVTGEVTNLRAQSSGHMYFTLKDAGAQLSCVLFRGEAVRNRSVLQDGQKLLLQGDVTVYEARGQYQLIVRAVELQGVGALQIAFEKLKQQLAAEGLFAPERKRPLPKYPQRIGLVTSPTGAAIRDVLHVVQRRNPALEIILAPCRVQGDGAAAEIAAAIRLLNEWHVSQVGSSRCDDRTAQRAVPTNNGLDLILVTRGGGSLEDLWAFNEEVVARAIFESAIPVVSAIGHEIDFTISDFVADARAATPSAAAEIITEGVFASREFVAEAPGMLRRMVHQRLEDAVTGFKQLQERLTRVHPRRRLDEFLQRLDDLQTGLQRCAKQGTKERQVAWQNLATRLSRVRPAQLLKQRRELLKTSRHRLRELAQVQLRNWRNRFSATEARLRLLGPEQVLSRGYSITTDAVTGKVLRAAAEVKGGRRLKTRLKIGEIFSRTEE
ncbi:MAG TPA: exodeoxyribonuclease VII large subunit [Verrucomicrobiae bacterium]|nr:exodeoxyribonuclease VII large subunit [Verrucomicrobiae bacterium]